MRSPASSAPPARLGRFKLLDELGRGAQATVWRALDEHLDREVALKLIDTSADAMAVGEWMHEARAVSRLAHPHIVPLFEAGEIDGQPCMVFELVRGRSLAQALKEGGPMSPQAAATMLLGVVDALGAAHAQGIVHRDLKPSNILIDADGRARVMDFGIAARVTEAGDGTIAGTPGYISPEAARGLPPSPGMDVFAAGVVLAEMLSGRRLIAERDPRRALARVVAENLVLPEDVVVDDGLRHIVQRALRRDPAVRYEDAKGLHKALNDWLAPGSGGQEAVVASLNTTLDFLLRRMRHKSDFPALSQSIARVQRIASSEGESLATLAAEILKDVALSNKLLRLVNTAHFRGAGGGTISTVSRAVSLVGFAGIRNMALSLMLIEHMQDKAHAQRLRAEFLRALTAGQLATELASGTRESEEAFLGAMLANLGRLLTEYYLPDEAQAIRMKVDAAAARGQTVNVQAISAQVLGLGFDQLGIGVARSWGLPESLQRCMAIGADAPPARPASSDSERLRWIAVSSNEAADAVLQADPSQLSSQMNALAERYGRALGVGSADFRHAAEAARRKLTEVAPALGLPLPKGLHAQVDSASAGPALTRTADDLPATLPMTQATLVADHSRTPDQAAAALSAGVQDITGALAADHVDLNDVLGMVIEAIYRAFNLQRIVLCLRDPKTGTLVGRFGLGDRIEALCPLFRIPTRLTPGMAPDVFAAVCLRGADTLISNATVDSIERKLPAWFRQHVKAPSFLLLPLCLKGSPFGLIYADAARPAGLELQERELALIRTLRNQAVIAFRHAG